MTARTIVPTRIIGWLCAAAIVLVLFAGLWLLCAAFLPPMAWFPAGAAALIVCVRWMNIIAEWLE